MYTFCLLILALAACLEMPGTETPEPTQAGTVAGSSPLPTAQTDTEPESGAVFEIPTAQPETCGTITAVQTVNLREEPKYHSDVIYWLPTKTQVKVLERGEWWKVRAGEFTGYVNANYVQEADCP